MKYDGRPGWRHRVRAGTWNLGCPSRKGGEVCEELRKRMNDVSCLQEVRWRGQGARMLGVNGRRHKLWRSRKGDGAVGVER